MNLSRNEAQDQTGFVLPAVLIAILALAAVAVAIVGAARRANDTFVLTKSQVEQRLRLESAFEVVTYGLLEEPNVWQPRNAPYLLSIGLDKFEVRMQASAGLYDLNQTEPADLAQLFLLVGASIQEAETLADRVADWRDTDRLARQKGAERSEYQEASLQRPGDRSFNSIDELSLVMGITARQALCMAPLLTVDSGLSRPVSPLSPLALRSVAGALSEVDRTSLTTGNAVEIEISLISQSAFPAKPVLTTVIRTTGRRENPIMVHTFEFKARPIRNEIPKCFG